MCEQRARDKHKRIRRFLSLGHASCCPFAAPTAYYPLHLGWMVEDQILLWHAFSCALPCTALHSHRLKLVSSPATPLQLKGLFTLIACSATPTSRLVSTSSQRYDMDLGRELSSMLYVTICPTRAMHTRPAEMARCTYGSCDYVLPEALRALKTYNRERYFSVMCSQSRGPHGRVSLHTTACPKGTICQNLRAATVLYFKPQRNTL